MTESITVTQAMIDAFALLTGDTQWIHTDPDRAANSTAGSTVAHGMLVASLILPLTASAIDDFDEVRGFEVQNPNVEVINLGLERLTFAHPVPVGGVITADARHHVTTPRGADLDVSVDITVWLLGKRRRIAASALLNLRYRAVSS